MIRSTLLLIICVLLSLSGFGQTLATSIDGNAIDVCNGVKTVTVTLDGLGAGDTADNGTFTVTLPAGLVYEGNFMSTGDIAIVEDVTGLTGGTFTFAGPLATAEAATFTIDVQADCTADGSDIDIMVDFTLQPA